MIKRFLAVIVALSLFVCTAVSAFAAVDVSTGLSRWIVPTSGQSYFSWPYFTSSSFGYFVNGVWSPMISLWSSPTVDPFATSGLSYSFSPITSDRFRLWFYLNDVDGTSSYNGSSQKLFGNRVLSGFYSSTLTFDTSVKLSDFQLSHMVFDVSPGDSNFQSNVYSSVQISSSPLTFGSYRYSFTLSYYIPSDIETTHVALFVVFSSSIPISYISVSPATSPPSAFESDFSGLLSYFMLQEERSESNYSGAVPDGLSGQQQEAQNQLTDYENKEQQVFDNLNTSLDNLNLNQYQQFDTSIVSAMTFVNRYVTAGFDGLRNFKIILFLPMVIGIGLSVIGRMGAMMSRQSVSTSMTSSQIRRNAKNYTSNGRTTRRR